MITSIAKPNNTFWWYERNNKYRIWKAFKVKIKEKFRTPPPTQFGLLKLVLMPTTHLKGSGLDSKFAPMFRQCLKFRSYFYSLKVSLCSLVRNTAFSNRPVVITISFFWHSNNLKRFEARSQMGRMVWNCMKCLKPPTPETHHPNSCLNTKKRLHTVKKISSLNLAWNLSFSI